MKIESDENEELKSCCKNTPKFFVYYKIGSKYFVCDNCIKFLHWSRGIQEMVELD